MSENGSHSHTSAVAEHYNKKDETDLAARSKSRIFYLRNFNNWIKSVLINEFIKKLRENNQREISVLDLGCGRGGDILKWKKANVTRVTFADIAEKSLDECKKRYFNPKADFEAEFITLDATKELLKDKIQNIEHDLVSSQFVLHYSFESYEQSNTFLKNVSDSLKPGGYFIGTTTNAYELVKRLRESDSDCFGNEIYNIKFHQQDKENFDLFGVKFDFQLENVVECPEFLVNFKALIKLAEKHKLKLLFSKNFSEFFQQYSNLDEYKNLISIMQALEPYYPRDLSQDESNRISGDYEYIEEKLKDDEFRNNIGKVESYATLSKSEWEAINLYLAFAFVKESDKDETENENLKKKSRCSSISSSDNENQDDYESKKKNPKI